VSGGENDDRELDRYLRGDSEVSRLYRQGADEQPPPELDARIVAQAHRDAAPRRAAAGPLARRWTLPVSLAAVVVLSVSVVLLMQEPDLVPISEPSPARDMPPGARAGRSGLESAAGEGEADRARPGSKAAPAPLEKRSRSSGLREAPEDALAPPPISAETAPSRQERSAPATPRPSEEIAPTAEDAPASAVRPADGATEAMRADPQEWLRFIDALTRRGDEQRALRELGSFRDRYPDHPLPPRLRDLAESVAR